MCRYWKFQIVSAITSEETYKTVSGWAFLTPQPEYGSLADLFSQIRENLSARKNLEI